MDDEIHDILILSFKENVFQECCQEYLIEKEKEKILFFLHSISDNINFHHVNIKILMLCLLYLFYFWNKIKRMNQWFSIIEQNQYQNFFFFIQDLFLPIVLVLYSQKQNQPVIEITVDWTWFYFNSITTTTKNICVNQFV